MKMTPAVWRKNRKKLAGWTSQNGGSLKWLKVFRSSDVPCDGTGNAPSR